METARLAVDAAPRSRRLNLGPVSRTSSEIKATSGAPNPRSTTATRNGRTELAPDPINHCQSQSCGSWAPTGRTTTCATPLRLALQRAHTTADGAVLIGYTPADIEGAHANGVRVIAVATGRSDEAALRDADAEVVLPDLRDAELLVKLVGNGV
ncbi:hypothetical protein CLM62_33730 [Streptomyces sp. SA15]|uniref:HAD family hydrolase n=1 Tax=Streptomyces sp. SA15 TaxID=934019 RepID=UPI000BAEBF9C|nr:HAD hydrolase-like protein [Streptomyces sp. SA15]PAZ11768.1 hypothetical protein CLM62_33730 [Streptomyces sp. SA15]